MLTLCSRTHQPPEQWRLINLYSFQIMHSQRFSHSNIKQTKSQGQGQSPSNNHCPTFLWYSPLQDSVLRLLSLASPNQRVYMIQKQRKCLLSLGPFPVSSSSRYPISLSSQRGPFKFTAMEASHIQRHSIKSGKEHLLKTVFATTHTKTIKCYQHLQIPSSVQLLL